MRAHQIKFRALFSLFGITFALLLGGWWLVHPADAATGYEVVCPADGNGPEDMLRAAVVAVNTMPEYDSIVISVTGAECLFTLVDAAGDYGNGPVGLPRITCNLLIRADGGRAIIERSDSAPQFRLMESMANLTVEKLTLRNGAAKFYGSGGAIYVQQSLTLRNMTFTGNTSYRGGAVYVAGSLVMDQVTATGNRTYSASPSHGGAIAVDGDLASTNITLTHNIAEDCFCGGDQAHGGGVYVGGSAVISAAVFTDNRSVQNAGGGLYVNGNLTLSNSNFVSNSARYLGGGINVQGNLTLSSSDFVSNSTDSDGGGVFVSGTSNLSDVHFIRNVATFSGGGLASNGLEVVTATVEASSFISNQAQYGAGAIFQRGYVRNTLFEENRAKVNGPTVLGGGALVAYTQATIENSRFIRNTAAVGGAFQLLSYPPDATIDVSRITNNLWVNNAARDGAAISIGVDIPGFQGDHVEITHNTIVRQTSNDDSALHIVKSTADVTNNIITQHRLGVHASDASVIADANLVHANAINYLGIEGGPNDLTGDPIFVDPANQDFHLQAGSPAQDSGKDLGVAADLDGVSRPQGKGYERGAFEIVYVNALPTGQPDTYTTPLDTSLIVAAPGLLDNDSDPDGDALTVTVATLPAHGEVLRQPAGAFIYTPTTGFTGTDSFTYQVSDGTDSSAAVAVTIEVTSEPSPQPVGITGLKATNDGPGTVGRALNFVASVETGSDIGFVWDFGNGATGEGATVSQSVYAEAGSYEAQVTASNSASQATAELQVVVEPTTTGQNAQHLHLPFVER